MKRLLLELGGKGAAVVCDDADLDLAVTRSARCGRSTAVRSAPRPRAAMVHRSRYQELVDRLAAMAGALPVGDPLVETTVVGPLISGAQRDRVEAHIAAGAAEGAELVVDGRGPDIERGFYVAPTLIAGCTADMKPVQEEIFGPVDRGDPGRRRRRSGRGGEQHRLRPLRLRDHATTPHARSALAKRLRSGNVGINTAQRNMEAPFGGFKLSGVGRDGGDFGLLAYTEMQTVVWPG